MKITINLELETNAPKLLRKSTIAHTKKLIVEFLENSLKDLQSRLKCNAINITFDIVPEKTILGIPYRIDSIYNSEEKCLMDGYVKTMDDDGVEVWEKNNSYAEVSGWI